MIRFFVSLGIVGVAAVLYLVWTVGPESQLPPSVTLLKQFEADGAVPGPGEVVENEELEHGIFEVPPMDEVKLEEAMANMDMGGMDMPGMDMSGSGELDMDMDGDGVMDMSSADMNTGGTTMEMAEGTTMETTEGTNMEMAEGSTMEMAEGETMEMAEAEEEGDHEGEADEEEAERLEAGMMAGLVIRNDGAFDREISLTMTEWGFSDLEIDAKPGERIRFTLRNEGQILHEFMFMSMAGMQAVNYRATRADWNLLEHEALYEKSLLLPGQEVSFVAQVMKPGVWMFMCMLPYHMQMGMMGQMATEGMAMEM
jgi:uncharacterized cupredoxin-like copper-binding protein